jgi:hypothetical protein
LLYPHPQAGHNVDRSHDRFEDALYKVCAGGRGRPSPLCLLQEIDKRITGDLVAFLTMSV